MSNTKVITKENFEAEVMQADRPVLIDFWAPWCVYCRRIGPALERLADEQADTLTVGTVNIDEQPELVAQFAVDTIPTLYLFRNGEHGERLVAPASQDQIEDWIHAQN